MRHENYKIMIGTNISRTATLAADINNAALGEIFAVKPDMTFLEAGETIADAEYIYIAQCTDATLNKFRFSAKIQGANVHKWKGQSQVDDTQQVTHVGYDGSSGSILLNNSAEYTLSIILRYDKVQGSERQYVRRFSYTSDATATEAEIAADFITQINADSVLSDKVAASLTSSGTNRGIALTGEAQTYNVIDGYEQVTFKVVVDGAFIDGGTTPVAYTTDPIYGIGTYTHVSDLERAAVGMEGINNLMKFPVPSYPVYAASGSTYDMYAITHDDLHASANLNKDMKSPEMTLIAMYEAAGQGASLEGELNPWFASCPGAFANVVL